MKPPRPIKKHGRERWLVDLREFGAGRRFFETESGARSFQREISEEQAEHGRLAFELPAETRRRYLRLDKRAAALGTTIEAALDFWERSKHAKAEKPLSDAIGECVAAKRAAGRRRRYINALSSILTMFGRDLPGVQCHAVTSRQIEQWLAGMKWQNETKRSATARLSVFFGYCSRQGWIAENPCDRLEEISFERQAPGILDPAEVSRLLETCRKVDKQLLPFLVLSIFAGLRGSEAAAAEWTDVDLKAGYVRVDAAASKTRERRLVKLQPNAVAWLKLDGLLPPENPGERAAVVRRKAGWQIDGKGKGKPWPKNAMRHSFCSYALPKFGASKTAEWAGHSEAMLFKHYRELVSAEAAERFWGIGP